MVACVLFCLLASVSFGLAIEDYCSSNNIEIPTGQMKFTKEVSFEEFAIAGTFKGLHCCAKGYMSIEWFKDGKDYPWPRTVSQLILYPESNNQTVYTQSVTEDDAGNYTCVLRSTDNNIITHSIYLKVFEKIPDEPKITYISDDRPIAVGENLRLFCEAFAGHVNLPDARSEAVWTKTGDNGTFHKNDRIMQKKVSREDEQTFGTYLIISDVRQEDFGEYICQISKPGTTINRKVFVQAKRDYQPSNPVPLFKLVFVSSILACVLLIIFVAYLRYGLKTRVLFKDTFGPLEIEDGKSSDVLIVYSPKDAEIALGVLLPTLENHYNYKCASRELPDYVTQWFTHLLNASQNCRRVVAILSPGTFNENWDKPHIQLALKQLQGLGSKLTVISLKEMPIQENETKNSQGETLASIVRAMNVIFWERNDDKFWLNLRLRLPPLRTNNMEGRRGIPARLTIDSSGSLNNLV